MPMKYIRTRDDRVLIFDMDFKEDKIAEKLIPGGLTNVKSSGTLLIDPDGGAASCSGQSYLLRVGALSTDSAFITERMQS